MTHSTRVARNQWKFSYFSLSVINISWTSSTEWILICVSSWSYAIFLHSLICESWYEPGRSKFRRFNNHGCKKCESSIGKLKMCSDKRFIVVLSSNDASLVDVFFPLAAYNYFNMKKFKIKNFFCAERFATVKLSETANIDKWIQIDLKREDEEIEKLSRPFGRTYHRHRARLNQHALSRYVDWLCI